MTIHEVSELLHSRQISAMDSTRAVLDRVDAIEAKVRAFITLTPDLAMEQAAAADDRLKWPDAPRLCGIPLGLKDVLSTRNVKTTCGSKILENFLPPYDATVVRMLREAGAVTVGKTNMDEFAMGSSTENSGFFPTLNPWDIDRVPGGSSGGSAAAVAADECIAALGSDTGGSVRQPAALCGVVGMRPTYGRVSRYGLVAFASSLDQIGPITKDVTDCAILMQAISGHDESDSTSLPDEVPDYEGVLDADVSGLKIGLPREYMAAGVDDGVRRAVLAAIDELADAGAEIADMSLPHTEYALATYYVIAPAEASANLARYNGVKYGYFDPNAASVEELMMNSRGTGFGAEVKRRVMLGTFALSTGYYDAYYLKAQKVRTLIKRDFDRAFESVDLIATPTTPTVAFAIGEKADDPISMYLSDVMTLPGPMAGIPGISVPCGFSEGLPVGLQFMAPPLGESILLRAAYAYEQLSDVASAAPEKAV
ncbi:MAG: Asp-tRNA(Asn)/Glu-tRNA(Gln) amidotransferase subunit GatA [Gammaproteobacteria bacterium]|nr:Asp-tRNA(Asn)/Glu-tRNA(Gln) amidotransferase subunit GatA [Gammaproteobacteria bacterium]